MTPTEVGLTPAERAVVRDAARCMVQVGKNLAARKGTRCGHPCCRRGSRCSSGANSDPRFLLTVPEELPFFRVAWLEVVRMGYRGRLGHTGDVGYLFGQPPPSTPGRHIIPGRMTDADPKGKQADHPCPRKLGHVSWLVNRWTAHADVVCDPFAGSGTTGVACRDLGRACVLIEIEERYCEIAAQRCSQGVLDLRGSA